MPPTIAQSSIASNQPTSVPSDQSIRHFNQIDLSRRWKVSPRTLERWRWLNQGPAYLKIGGRVVYRLEDITAYEGAQTKTPTKQIREGGAR